MTRAIPPGGFNEHLSRLIRHRRPVLAQMYLAAYPEAPAGTTGAMTKDQLMAALVRWAERNGKAGEGPK